MGENPLNGKGIPLTHKGEGEEIVTTRYERARRYSCSHASLWCMGRRFTEEELNAIIIDYNNGMRPIELGDKYKRNPSSIINKLKEIDVYVDSRINYTEDDEAFLAEKYPLGDWDAIFKRFPGVTRSVIHTKVNKMGIKADSYHWRESDIELLGKSIYNKSLDEMYDLFEGRYTKEAIRTKASRKFGYSTNDDWTDEENENLRKYYPIMPIDDLLQYFPGRSRDAIINHAVVIGVNSYLYLSTYWDDEAIQILLDNWETRDDAEIAQMVGKQKNSVKAKRYQLNLYRSKRDRHGYASISSFLRGKLTEWKKSSMENCGYACVLTGSKDFDIHHIYSFNKIVSDTFENNNLTNKPFVEYSDLELDEIAELFLKEHNKYPLGVCIGKDLHVLFHSIYGKCNNERQWNEFCENYRSGFFKNIA